MHTHPFLQKYSSLNKTTLFWISHAESGERRKHPPATCFSCGAYRNGAARSPGRAARTSPGFAAGFSAGPGTLPSKLQSPLPALCAQGQDSSGVVDRTEPSCRRIISESGWRQLPSCSSNPTEQPSDDNHTKLQLQSRHKANMGMQGIPRTLELGLWPDTSLSAPSSALLHCSFPCPEATYALSLPALLWLTPVL